MSCFGEIMPQKISRWILLILTLIFLTGCSQTPTDVPDQTSDQPLEGARITGASLDEANAGSKSYFTLRVEEAGQPIGIDFRGALMQGSLGVRLLNAEEEIVWETNVTSVGPFAINTVVKPETTGEHQLILSWPGPVQASYNLQWQPGEIEVPEISPLVLLPGIGMILVALGYVIYAAVRRLGWAYLGLGALGWIVTVALKFAWAIPVNTPLYEALTSALPETIAHGIFYIYVGALTGIFEVAVTWGVLRYTKLGQVPWQRALAFGIGFGAVEALALGVSSLASTAVALFMPASMPLAALEQIAQVNNVLYGLAPIVERFFTALIHVLTNVLLFYGVAKKEARWFWLAFAYKTGIDVVAAFGQFWGLDTLAHLWTIEAIAILWGIVGWWGTRWVKQHYPSAEEPSNPKWQELPF